MTAMKEGYGVDAKLWIALISLSITIVSFYMAYYRRARLHWVLEFDSSKQMAGMMHIRIKASVVNRGASPAVIDRMEFRYRLPHAQKRHLVTFHCFEENGKRMEKVHIAGGGAREFYCILLTREAKKTFVQYNGFVCFSGRAGVGKKYTKKRISRAQIAIPGMSIAFEGGRKYSRSVAEMKNR